MYLKPYNFCKSMFTLSKGKQECIQIKISKQYIQTSTL